MSQTWTDDSYAAGHVGQTDLQNMENNFAAIKSMFSGASQPSNVVEGMHWFDTAKLVQKIYLDGEWRGLFHGDVSEKRIVYRSSEMDGYARDSGVTDKVISLKGGSVYTTGGSGQGSWTISGLAKDAHTHTIAHTHTLVQNTQISTAAVHSKNVANTAVGGIMSTYESTGGSTTINRVEATTNASSAANSGAQSAAGVTHTPAWRPLAAVCILVYLDL